MIRIGIDLGGTKTEAIALGSGGDVLRRERVATVAGDYLATLGTIRDLVQGIEAALGETGTVGVGIPGTLTRDAGRVKNANSIWLNGRTLQADLSQTLQREVRCSNDANCFTVSEARDGAGAGAHSVFGVILGTGCGGGLVIDEGLHTGPNGLTGEWGHLPLPWPAKDEMPGPPCYCGRHGCLETWISGTGFERDQEARTGSRLTGQAIVGAMRAGDSSATAAFERLVHRIARGLALVVGLLDPECIVLGGGLSNIEELYDGRLQLELSRQTFGGDTQTPILKNKHGDSSGVRGAAWLWPAD